MRPWDGPVFGIGLNAGVREFRSTDQAGRPVDPAAEGETQRRERIELLQRRRLADGERTAPPVAPAAVLAEWFTRRPAERLGRFGTALAERGPEMIPRLLVELPGREPVTYGEPVRRGRQPSGVMVTELPGRVERGRPAG